MDEKGIPTECETTERSKRAEPSVDLDAVRELRRAAKRIVALETALLEIKTASCSDEKMGATCLCCVHDRAIATTALDNVG